MGSAFTKENSPDSAHESTGTTVVRISPRAADPPSARYRVNNSLSGSNAGWTSDSSVPSHSSSRPLSNSSSPALVVDVSPASPTSAHQSSPAAMSAVTAFTGPEDDIDANRAGGGDVVAVAVKLRRRGLDDEEEDEGVHSINDMRAELRQLKAAHQQRRRSMISAIGVSAADANTADGQSASKQPKIRRSGTRSQIQIPVDSVEDENEHPAAPTVKSPKGIDSQEERNSIKQYLQQRRDPSLHNSLPSPAGSAPTSYPSSSSSSHSDDNDDDDDDDELDTNRQVTTAVDGNDDDESASELDEDEFDADHGDDVGEGDEVGPWSGRVPWCPRCPSWRRCSRRAWEVRRLRMHAVMENSNSTILARFVAYFSMLMIALSVVSLIIETEPSMANNGRIFSAIETVCVVFFTVEYLIRFWCSMLSAVEFVRNFSNLLDLVSILPFYIFITAGNASGASLFRVLRLVRIFRIFRISRYVSWFKVFSDAMRESAEPLMMILFVLLCAVIFLASILFFLERGELDDATETWMSNGQPSDFQSIPDTMWFVLISVCTVGYGDITPQTALGKILSGVICLCGTLVLSIPVSVVSQNFANEYEKLERQKLRIRQQMMGLKMAQHIAVERRALTLYSAEDCSIVQLRILHRKHEELLREEIDRILDHSSSWLADVDHILRVNKEKTHKHFRSIITRQLNGEIWGTS